VVAAGGAVAAVAAMRRIMPRGMLAMRPGPPVATMALFCCAFAFFAADGFVPLLPAGGCAIVVAARRMP
jgi:hypothetical protein